MLIPVTENGVEPHFSLRTRLRLALAYVAHHVGVGVYGREFVEIIPREGSQKQPVGLDRLHRQYWARPFKGGPPRPPLQANYLFRSTLFAISALAWFIASSADYSPLFAREMNIPKTFSISFH